MLEQEMASIIRFVLDRAGGPAAYYWNVPQHFSVPAAYFPTPEVDTSGETFLTYGVDYAFYIKLFHKTQQRAYAMGFDVLTAVRKARNLIPLISADGKEIEGSWVRVSDPKLKVLDDGAAQLTINWRCRRAYSDVEAGATKAQTINFDVTMQSSRTITDAYAAALERYAIPINKSGEEPR